MPNPTPPTTKAPAPANGSELPPRLLAKLKVEIDGYELIERLGEGGQAAVYRAIQKKDGQMVAVKVLHAGPHATEEARARLKREINALRAINHPNIVHAIAAGRTRSGLDCLVMNFIDGKPLDALWADPAFAAMVAPQPADLLRLFKTICETVQAAHRKGITHRDLSPSNILIDATGQPHILDFGMASTAFDGIVNGGRDVTVTGQFIGKLKYASPEQARGARTAGSAGEAAGADIRSDVYALGVMLYQLLTGGVFPYEVVGNVIDVLQNIIHSKPRPPSETIAELHTPAAALAAGFGDTGVPPVAKPKAASAPVRRNPPLVNETIEAIVLKALEKHPDQRYQSAGELAADINRYLAGQPTSAVVWSARARGTRTPFRFRRPFIVAASVVVIATLVGITMNAKSLAVWLGVATVAAPMLPTEVTPLAPSTAEAAMLEAEFQPDVQATDKRLTKLAEDLALVEAKLNAVSRQLVAVDPKLELPAEAKGGPMAFNAFLAKLSQSSTDAGRPLQLPAMSREDFDRLVKSEAEALSRETDKDVLLGKRRDLDDQQATLWAQVAYGTFTGREVDRIFRFRAKSLSPMNEASTARSKAIEHGVKVRRLCDNAFRSMGEAPMAGGGPIDLCTRFTAVAEQPKNALVDFRQAVMDGRDANGLTDDDRKGMGDLADLAKGLTDSLDGAAESQTRLTKEDGEMARFVNRGRLQQDLLDAVAATARLDQRLVALSKTWQVDVDTASKLGPVVPAVAKRPEPPTAPKSKPREIAAGVPTVVELFPVDSTWSGTFMDVNLKVDLGFAGTVTKTGGNTVTIQWRDSFGDWEMQVVARDERLVVVTCIGLDPDNGPLRNVFRDIRIDGPIPQIGETVELSGVWTITRLPSGKQEVYRPVFKIRNNAPAKAVAAKPNPKREKTVTKKEPKAQEIALIFPPNSTYDIRWRSKKGWETNTATVTSVEHGIATVRWNNSYGTWDSQIEVVGGRVKMRSCNGVGRGTQGQQLSTLTNLDITGPADEAARAGTIRLSGTWDWHNDEANADNSEHTEFEFYRK